MTDPEFKFREKYRVPSNRLTGYDYSSEGAYFITICTKNRENYFGEIIERAMGLNEYGKIVKNEILDMENHFKDVTVDEFVVMPNHVHLILVLGNIDDSGDKTTDDDEPTHCRDAINRVSTGGDNHEG